MSEAMITRRGGGGSSRLQSKAVSITEAPTTVVPDSGYDGMSTVTVDIAAESQIAATSYTPGTQAQTIAANKWLAGAQTIQGDANLLATNIKKGVSIFNVAGSYEASGLDTDSAVLKVVTSTGCSVNVSNVAGGGSYDITQPDSEGFVRTGDANVTEHFFVIPTAAFGTFSVISTHPTYGDNTKTNAVVIGNAGKVYEVLCGGINIILDGTFGLQDGFLSNLSINGGGYSERYKKILPDSGSTSFSGTIVGIPIGPYDTLTIAATGSYANAHIDLVDNANVTLCKLYFGTTSREQSGAITDKYSTVAKLDFSFNLINEITKIILT